MESEASKSNKTDDDQIREDIDSTLNQEKEKQVRLLEENRQLEKEFETYQNSLWMKAIQKVNRLKYYLRQLMKIVSGKRDYKDVFSKPHKKKKAKKRIKQVTYRLYDLGFSEKALKELESIVTRSDNQFLVELAEWELVSWYANKATLPDYQKAASYMHKVAKKRSGLIPKRKLVLMQAEIYTQLGMKELAEDTLAERMEYENHIDLFFGMANIKEEFSEKIACINDALSMNGQIEIDLHPNENNNKTAYDRLQSTARTLANQTSNIEDIKVSIIVPSFNAEENIATTMDSLLTQTWTNVEIIVVDDCSKDNTLEIIQSYAAKDQRVSFLQNEENSGPYVGRNRALDMATGDFITINDADDWSHPEKIAYQAKHLITHPDVVANTSLQARLTEDLTFFRRGKAGVYAFANMSSLMFKREIIKNKIGYWDSVRFGADAEFKKRLIHVFGKEAVQDLNQGVYSFQRQTTGSLTGSSTFGYHGFFMGARKEYREAYLTYHESAVELKYPFPMETRPFPIPEPMQPIRPKTKEAIRHFDVLIASEFRLLGGTNMSNIEEIKAQKREGLRTGLIQFSRYDLNSVDRINPNVRDTIDGDLVQMIVYGEKVSCDALIVRHPPALQDWQKYVPTIEAKKVHVIVNQPPKRDYSETGKTLYRIEDCLNNLQKYVGQRGSWFPIGPEIRRVLEEHHADELATIDLASSDWVNIIDVNEWKRDRYEPKQGVIRIGRHSRDQYVKWPETSEKIEAVYPSTSPYQIHVLGGAKSVMKIIGKLPENWIVKQFGEETPQHFLKNIDVFVYYTHSDWVEAFGRVMFEAMAAGVPVIIEPKYEKLFGEAAMYAKEDEVKGTIEKLMNDETLYQKQVAKAQAYVEKNFGYSKHIARIAGDVRG
ncbi:glycosyltransferase [Salipaludibacillus sp. HK11]|uniref:glycosyltransferase n=1 Tax=Salipaludibacillus sp. HK11 TaxID=3394320 RepID=UPI0039FCA447